jgi:hypothetical protein
MLSHAASACLNKLEARVSWANDRDKYQRLSAMVDYAVYTTDGCYSNVACRNGARLAIGFKLVFSSARKNRPSVLAMWMDMGRNTLTWFDKPGNYSSLRRLRDNRTNRLTIGGLHEVGTAKDSVSEHSGFNWF